MFVFSVENKSGKEPDSVRQKPGPDHESLGLFSS